MSRRPAGVVAVGCVLLALLVTVVSWSGVLLVVFERVIPLWQVATVLLLTALALAVLAARSGRPGSDRSKGQLPRWLTVTLAVVTCAGTGLTGLGDLMGGPSYTVLEQPALTGCRVVVRETSFLMAGGPRPG